MLEVIKRNGERTPFEKDKIVSAITRAMKYGSGILKPEIAEAIANEIEEVCRVTHTLTIGQIEDMVYTKLISKGQPITAKAYEGYRAVQEHKRETNTTDEGIMGLLNQSNAEVMSENSNKNPVIASTQRDLIAGEVSKDIARRKLIPSHLVQAHDNGAIHIHDMDYVMQPIFNCCTIDLADMLENGTVINGKLVETPKSFQVACTVATQIVAQIASNQYGGQTLGKLDTVLAPYARKSYDKAYKTHYKRLSEDLITPKEHIEELAKKYADEDMRKEIRDGVQTIQYQINTLMTSNGW